MRQEGEGEEMLVEYEERTAQRKIPYISCDL